MFDRHCFFATISVSDQRCERDFMYGVFLCAFTLSSKINQHI